MYSRGRRMTEAELGFDNEDPLSAPGSVTERTGDSWWERRGSLVLVLITLLNARMKGLYSSKQSNRFSLNFAINANPIMHLPKPRL